MFKLLTMKIKQPHAHGFFFLWETGTDATACHHHYCCPQGTGKCCKKFGLRWEITLINAGSPSAHKHTHTHSEGLSYNT